MATLYAGTSGWSYPNWKPKFYPAKLPATKFLQHYATRLNTVEVNYTFRHYATEKTQCNWLAVVPPEFKFSIKAHQNITHIRRLQNASELAAGFLNSLQPLTEAGRVGMVLFQLPPFLKVDAALLEAFLTGLPKSGRLSFEFRHQSWFADPIFALLQKFNAALCVAESEKLESPDVVTADFCYYRLRKGEYSKKEREQYAETFRQHLAKNRDVFVYFKHEETPDGAFYAEELLGQPQNGS